MDNPEKLATYGTQDEERHNTICDGHHYALTSTHNVISIRCVSLSCSPTLDHLWLINFDFIVGSQADQAYSSDGLTRNVYACSFTEVELMLRFRRRKSNIFIGLCTIIIYIALSFCLV